MSIALEAYTAEGLLTGSVVADGRLVDLLASFATVVVERAVITPFEGAPQRADGWATVDVDDLLVVVATSDTVTPFHSVWHSIVVDIGPYRVTAELPALPGFDPGRALARPTGSFILIGQAAIELRAERTADGGRGAANRHDIVWVNRYAVESVASDLELGFFFPGAMESATHSAIA
jgi:hypothetical protein